MAKNLTLLLLSMLAGLILAEGLAQLMLRAGLAGRESIASRRTAVLAPVGEADSSALAYDRSRAREGAIARAVIHPYLGFVHLPSDGQAKSLVTGLPFDPPCPINRYGFMGDADLLKSGPDRFNVLVLGGSVANQLFCMGRATLAAELASDQRLAGRRVQVLGLAISGWRQPQQLLGVVYYLSLGGQFDVVVDLEGYNLARDSAENVEQLHAHFDYPGDWQFLGPTMSEASIVRAARIMDLRERRRALAERFAPFQFSALAQLTWLLWDRGYERQARESSVELKAASGAEAAYSFAERGPRIPELNTRGEIVRLWRDAATQLGRVVRANGGQYFEMLQPNQFIEDSKRFSPEERKCCVQPDDVRVPRLLNDYYAAFAAEGRRLDPAVVHFGDLRYVFRDTKEQVYVDNCCHLNEAGTRIVARAIAAEIRRHLSIGSLTRP